MVTGASSESKNMTDDSKDNITIRFPSPDSANDTSLTSTLATIVNTVYHWAESDIFLPSYQRTSAEEIAQLLCSGHLAVAYLNSTDDPVGCVLIKLLSPERGDLGMLALNEQHRGSGLGRKMVLFAEDECRRRECTIMQLELIAPTTFRHAGKERMEGWYNRMGYSIVKLGSFNDEYPELGKILLGPVEYKIFEKSLV
ncbi:hypothetical protein AK830_g1279 [Neonectria ditissima]|uniref:N-acetyltransferase domain-containing protein n=1 Tax=Neonectria ditissima TaxID=78410 RepID=A0A0P7C021_9HYPO|nr:hypothetical protein AK830_g1279 [Neonectria ditissima]